MTKEIDFSKPSEEEPFPVAPPPSPDGVTGQMPLPVGRPMVVKKPSPGEQAILEEMIPDWKPGDVVPANFHEIVSAARHDAESYRPPVDLKTPAMTEPDEVGLDSLPPEKQKYYRDIASAAVETAENQLAESRGNLPPGVPEAILAADSGQEVPVIDDTKDDVYDSGSPKRPDELPPSPASPDVKCPKCGWDVSRADIIEVTENDKMSFLQSLLGGVAFVKTFDLFGGAISVSVRTLGTDELDACFAQATRDAMEEPVGREFVGLEKTTRYRTMLQLREVHGGDLVVNFPKHMSLWQGCDGNLQKIWEQFEQQLAKHESMSRLLIGAVIQFNNVVQRLEENMTNPDFWPAIGSRG